MRHACAASGRVILEWSNGRLFWVLTKSAHPNSAALGLISAHKYQWGTPRRRLRKEAGGGSWCGASFCGHTTFFNCQTTTKPVTLSTARWKMEQKGLSGGALGVNTYMEIKMTLGQASVRRHGFHFFFSQLILWRKPWHFIFNGH